MNGSRIVGRAPFKTGQIHNGTEVSVTLMFMSDGSVIWRPPADGEDRPSLIQDLFPDNHN